jgi:hypothetical protein
LTPRRGSVLTSCTDREPKPVAKSSSRASGMASWARSGDRLSDLVYDRLRMSKEVQLHMWTSFLERVIRLSGGTRAGGLRIDTRRVEEVSIAD